MTRPPLELLLEGWETRIRQLNENSRTEEDAHLSWYYGGRAAELSDCIQALRAQVEANSFQGSAVNWVREAFGSEPTDCRDERAHRFLEEALEAVQAAGTTAEEAQQLVNYVYSREQGEIAQEVGGVMLTLAPLAAAFGVDMVQAGEAELARVNTPEIIEKCRRKNASKPRNSPLPGSAALAQADAGGETVPPAPTYTYVKGGHCYVCGHYAALYRWDDYDESSECVCRQCAETALAQADEPGGEP